MYKFNAHMLQGPVQRTSVFHGKDESFPTELIGPKDPYNKIYRYMHGSKQL